MTQHDPPLIVFSGLPAAGKTTVARAVARALGAIYLRIDAIEQAIRDARSGAGEIGAAGYAAAQAVAEANLRHGLAVVADCVNPVEASREGWRAVAAGAGCPAIDVEIVCPDAVEHRRRATTRSADIAGLVPPSWEAILAHVYEPWTWPRLIVDTAALSADEAVALVIAHARSQGASPSAGGRG